MHAWAEGYDLLQVFFVFQEKIFLLVCAYWTFRAYMLVFFVLLASLHLEIRLYFYLGCHFASPHGELGHRSIPLASADFSPGFFLSPPEAIVVYDVEWFVGTRLRPLVFLLHRKYLNNFIVQ